MGTLLLLLKYKYVTLALLAFIEGPVLSLVSGFLIRIGVFSFWPVIAILVAGDIASDTFYYYLTVKGHGDRYVRRYGKKYTAISENFALLKNLWKRHGYLTMFLGKFAYGLTVPLVVSAALSKVRYKKLMAYIIPPTAIKYLSLIATGYYLAHSYQQAEKYIYLSILYVPLIFTAFFLGYKLILNYLRAKAGKE